ncbi:hypothetical protein O976_08425 [Mycobacterium avium subsp. paratuberculosis 10-8425]|nr:hypothetical protein O976_08425 [Mycobacterium avium subsp. paratuberculosis 10-8425]
MVCAPDGAVDELDRRCAATQLARLAKAGVPGADPASWHGLIPVSTAEPLRGGGDVVTLTPSTMQTLTDCRCAGWPNGTAAPTRATCARPSVRWCTP